jgi:hypothetical protein
VDERGGRFSQRWHLDARAWIPLPGDDKRWPQTVEVNAKRAVVVAQNGVPSVELEPGDHWVTGAFLWDSPPEAIPIPAETGLVALTLRGKLVESPTRDAVVWLQRATTKEEGDKLEFVVHRHVDDNVPLRLTTRIELNVAGKNREVLLGKALPQGFRPLALESPLPARVEADARLRVQVRPGTWTLVLTARSEEPLDALSRPAPDGPWREGDEVWVFEARPLLRVVSVEGVSAIDPQQTSLPAAWKKLPAYPMKLTDTLRLVEKRRGDADPPPDQLSLTRSLWLDFDGAGYTVSDKLSGTFQRDGRLEMAPPTVLGRVALRQTDQFITHLGDPLQRGVEVRQGEAAMSADSRIPASSWRIPAVGWKRNFHQVSATLHLPPGWRLFHASGVDEVPGTWLRHWSLFELFLVLVASLALGRLFGVVWGALALGTMVLVFPEQEAPRWAWLAVLAAEALVRVVPEGKAHKLVAAVRLGCLVVLALIAIPFAVEHLRQGMHPVLEHADASLGSESVVRDSVTSLMDGVPQQLEEQETPMVQRAAKSKGDRAGYGMAPTASTATARQYNMTDYDENAMVQTGPGVPRWNWSSLDLRWSGPVESTQEIVLFLVPPGANRFLALLRVGLMVALLLRLFAELRPRGRSSQTLAAAAVAAAAALACFLIPARASADMPDKGLLEELETRLLAKPECRPHCASMSRLRAVIGPKALELRVEIDAAAITAVPLPGGAQWSPTEVFLDGQPAKALARLDGQLWIAVDRGSHQVVLAGVVPAREAFQIALPLRPHRVEVVAEGWTVEGVHEDGVSDDNVQFTRLVGTQGSVGALQPSALPAFVSVHRSVRLGLNWQVETRVQRVSPLGAAVVIEVPLLASESVTTAEVRVVGGKALLNMGPQQSEVRWTSVLEQKSPVRLEAAKTGSMVEQWGVEVGPIWHATFVGIPQIAPDAGKTVPEWRPWPGETLSIEVSRPDGVPGQTLTVDRTDLEVRPGLRATDATWTLVVRSSRGAEHPVVLPEGAELTGVTIGGKSLPLRQAGRTVTLPIVPGAQRVVVTWRQPTGIALLYRTPSVDLGIPSVNATVRLVMPGGRWVLLVGGPATGPVVLFWSLLVVLVIVAAALGRIRWAPVRTWQWLLLAVGLSQVPVVAGAIVVGWLLAIGWRKERPWQGVFAFNLGQMALVGWTVVALVILVVAVQHGLLGSPEMQIRGNGADSTSLPWFQDRVSGTQFTSWVVSVPLLVYRALMLLWALWVALAVLGWLREGWQAFTSGGSWKRSPRTARWPGQPQVPPAAGAP